MKDEEFNNIVNKAVIPLIIILMFFTSKTSIINNLIKILIYLIILIPCLKRKISLNYLDFFLYFILLITCLLSCIITNEFIKYINIFCQLLCFYCILQYYNPENINISNLYFIFLILGLCWQFYRFKTIDNRSYLSSAGDPNYSGFYLFLWTCFTILTRKWIFTGFIIIISLKTFSRNYFIALLLFLLIRIKKIKHIIKVLFEKLKLSFWKLSIISIFFVLILGYFFLKYIDISSLDNVYNLDTYTNRFTSFIDGSNYYRFNANKVFLNELKSNLSKYFFGYNDILYKQSGINVPHNAFFLGILKYGISFIIYFIIYSRIINKKIFLNSLTIFIPVFIYMTILGLGINGIDIILLAIVIKINKSIESEE